MGIIEKLRESIPCVISRRTSFITMTILLGSFFIVEMVVGYITNSMALIADAFHMLSDVASLVVGFLALQYSTMKAPSEVYTYGYARAEVLGALVNAVFLVALCFSIFIEALKRLVILEEIENPVLVLIVGAIGLVVNLFGMLLFHQTGHGHSHGGLSHSHSHGGGGDSHGHLHAHAHGQGHGQARPPLMIPKTQDKQETDTSVFDPLDDGVKSHSTPVNKGPTPELSKSKDSFTPSLEDVPEEKPIEQKLINEEQQDKNKDMNLTGESTVSIPCHNGHNTSRHSKCTNASSEAFNRSHIKNISTAEDAEKNNHRFPTKFKSAGQLNIHAVYLHILGDALGSIIVMLSALIIIYAEGTWTLYVDPGMSIIMVAIILKTSIPLLIETAKILMNSVPHHIQINDLKKRLVEQIKCIQNVHELHVWQLAGEKIIASMHVKLKHPFDYELTSNRIKEFFHHNGIHSTTIQIEFDRVDDIDRRGPCMVVCSLDSACDEMMCCKPSHSTFD